MQNWKPGLAACALLLIAAVIAAAGQSSRPQRASSGPLDPPWASEDAMHAYFVDRFGASDGLGARRISGPLMTLNDGMTVSLPTQLDEGAPPVPREYRVQAFELIGVAKRKTPVAFVVRSHGNRGGALLAQPAPARIEPRPLTTFERNALGRLQRGEEVVVQPEGKGMTVVGAVRAKGDCVGCHAGYARGDVLGALSYRLTRLERQ